MAIDYVIDYPCVPKQELTTDGILDRIKGAERAEAIIKLYRDGGDTRPPSEMAFEFTRSTPAGDEETREFSVQDLLNAAADLERYQHHCVGCPANITGKPFGCMNFIQYPISHTAENWLLDRLPTPDDALIWLLLKQGVEDFQYDGATLKPLREMPDVYFTHTEPARRLLGEFVFDADQLFEMLLAVGHINPNHAALLLLFLHAVRRDIEADEIMNIRSAPDAQNRYPLLLNEEDAARNPDRSIREFAVFIKALYTGWKMQIRILIDA